MKTIVHVEEITRPQNSILTFIKHVGLLKWVETAKDSAAKMLTLTSNFKEYLTRQQTFT